MIREVKKEDFTQGFVTEMRAGDTVLVLTKEYGDYETARQKVANAKRRCDGKLPEGIADYTCERTESNMALVRAVAEK